MVASLVLQKRRLETHEVDAETISIKFSFEGSDESQLDMNSIYVLSDPVLNWIAQIKGNRKINKPIFEICDYNLHMISHFS
jgi:hypothetical protein